MAGRPILRKLSREIEDAGGIEHICDRIADGDTIGQIAESFGVSRRTLYTWRDIPAHKDFRRKLWAEAMRCSAEAEVEKSIADFDRLDRVIGTDPVSGEELRRVPTSAEVQLATGRAKWRQWYAGVKDPERYGRKDEGVQVNVNLGSLHVEALKQVKEREALPPAVEEAEWELDQ